MRSSGLHVDYSPHKFLICFQSSYAFAVSLSPIMLMFYIYSCKVTCICPPMYLMSSSRLFITPYRNWATFISLALLLFILHHSPCTRALTAPPGLRFMFILPPYQVFIPLTICVSIVLVPLSYPNKNRPL